MLVDQALRDEGGQQLSRALRERRTGREVPILVCCAPVAGWRPRPSTRAPTTSWSVRSTGSSPRCAPSAWSASARRRRELGTRTRGDPRPAPDARGRAAHPPLAGSLRRAHGTARRAAAGARARERPDLGLGDEPDGRGALRGRAPGAAQQPSRAGARELRAPAGRAAAHDGAALGPGAARDGTARALDGRTRGTRALRGRAHGPARSPGGEGRRARPARRALGPLSGRGRGDRARDERRRRPRAAGRPRRGHAAAEGGAGRLGGRRERRRDPLLRADRPADDRAQPGDHAPAAEGARARRAPPRLSAGRRRRGAARLGGRGAAALALARARRRAPVRVRPAGRGDRPDGPDRQLGAAHGLPAAARLARRGPRRRAACR